MSLASVWSNRWLTKRDAAVGGHWWIETYWQNNNGDKRIITLENAEAGTAACELNKAFQFVIEKKRGVYAWKPLGWRFTPMTFGIREGDCKDCALVWIKWSMGGFEDVG